MLRDSVAICVLTAVIASSGAVGQPVESASTFVDAVPIRIAFYEPAPRRLAAAMRNAIEERCGGGSPSSASWYCAGVALRFFRTVNVFGERYKNGLACDEEVAPPSLRFVPEGFFSDDERCVFVAYNSETKRHWVPDE